MKCFRLWSKDGQLHVDEYQPGWSHEYPSYVFCPINSNYYFVQLARDRLPKLEYFPNIEAAIHFYRNTSDIVIYDRNLSIVHQGESRVRSPG